MWKSSSGEVLPSYPYLPQSSVALFRSEGYGCRCNYGHMTHFNWDGNALQTFWYCGIADVLSGGPPACFPSKDILKKMLVRLTAVRSTHQNFSLNKTKITMSFIDNTLLFLPVCCLVCGWRFLNNGCCE